MTTSGEVRMQKQEMANAVRRGTSSTEGNPKVFAASGRLADGPEGTTNEQAGGQHGRVHFRQSPPWSLYPAIRVGRWG